MKRIRYFLIILIVSMSCSSHKVPFSQVEFSELNKKGYKIILDSDEIDLTHTYLNRENISSATVDRANKVIVLERLNKNTGFSSLEEVLTQKKYSSMDRIVINNCSIDSLDIPKTKFEDESIKYIYLLTQKDYQGKEFDDLPQVKRMIGNGILIINTTTNSANSY